MPWSGTAAPLGFGPDRSESWLPQPPEWSEVTVEAQDDDPRSHLSLYRDALRIRRRHPALGDGRMRWVDVAADVLCFDRDPGFRCIVNLGATPIEVPADAEVVLTSAPLDDGKLVGDAAVWLSR
jgi:alpha-glucosidase